MPSLRRNSLEDRARKLLDDLDIQTIPVPVDRIARTLGAEIRFSPLDEELSGFICIRDDVPIIGVNTLHHRNRQRFTIAHEIAHLHLHREHITSAVHVDKQFAESVLKRDSASATGTEWLEIEANRFAAALLMPKHILVELLTASPIDINDDGPIEGLSKKFHVSKATLQFRIRNLLGELQMSRRV
jgi:Zn-dependent peptidase ImmA (M78 family)